MARKEVKATHIETTFLHRLRQVARNSANDDRGHYEAGGDASLWHVTLNENMGASTAGLAECDLVWLTEDLSGDDTLKDQDVYDPFNQFTHLASGDDAFAIEQGGMFFFVQPTDVAGGNLYRFTTTEVMGASTSNEASATITTLAGASAGTGLTVKDKNTVHIGLPSGILGYCQKVGADYHIVEVEQLLFHFTLTEDMGYTTSGEATATITTPGGASVGTGLKVHDGHDLYTSVPSTTKGLCLLAGGYYQIIEIYASNTHDIYRWTATANYASSAIVATVTDMDGTNSTASQSVKDPHALHAHLLSGAKGLAYKGSDGLYQIIEVENELIYRFEINGSWTSNTAPAKIGAIGAGAPTATGFTVQDPIGIFSGLTSGDNGICQYQSGYYYIIQSECP